MKVVGISGSPRKDGNTAIILRKVFGALEKAGIETELLQLADEPVVQFLYADPVLAAHKVEPEAYYLLLALSLRYPRFRRVEQRGLQAYAKRGILGCDLGWDLQRDRIEQQFGAHPLGDEQAGRRCQGGTLRL